MDVALGWKPRSGWAALVVLADANDAPALVDRRRVELVDEGADWARQPYHAAEGIDREEGRALVARAVASAGRHARLAMQAAVARAESAGQRVVGCAVLMGSGMPAWSVDEILAVHFRMHKAEGELFRGALAEAARACELHFVPVPEKTLDLHGAQALGRGAGPPWGKDQKQAAVAAKIALETRGRRTR